VSGLQPGACNHVSCPPRPAAIAAIEYERAIPRHWRGSDCDRNGSRQLALWHAKLATGGGSLGSATGSKSTQLISAG